MSARSIGGRVRSWPVTSLSIWGVILPDFSRSSARNVCSTSSSEYGAVRCSSDPLYWLCPPCPCPRTLLSLPALPHHAPRPRLPPSRAPLTHEASTPTLIQPLSHPSQQRAALQTI
eukprot:445868-Rhodomonas_salina.2